MRAVKWLAFALASLVLLLALLLAAVNSSWFKGYVAGRVSEAIGRTVTIEGDLGIDLGWPPRAHAEGIRVANAPWGSEPYMLELAVLAFRIDVGALLGGRVVLPEIVLSKPRVLLEVSPQGQKNWEFATAPSDTRSEPPVIGRLAIEDGRLRFRDPTQAAAIDATFATVQKQDGGEDLAVNAEGRYQNEPFKLRFTGDSLLALRDPDKPYSLEAALTVAKTQAQVQGELNRPLELQGVDLAVAVQGPDPALLSPLVGYPLPELPPYNLKGQLSRQGNTLKLTNFNGRLGDSDLAGAVEVDLGGKRPRVNADLTSRKVDFDDLAGLIGGTPDTGPGETASEEQKREAAAKQQSPYLLPRKPLNLKRLGATFNGTINFQSKRVEALKLPLDNIGMKLVINDGKITFKPLEFGVGGGSVRSQMSINTGASAPQGELETEIRRVDLNRVLKPFAVGKDSFGTIGGRMKFWVSGDSIAEFLASADGGLFLLMNGGRLDALLTELAGLDAGESLAVLFTDPKANVPIECAYADLHSKNGIMQLETVVIDTSDTLFLAGGFIDFNQELIKLVIEPKPKDFSLLSARSPLHIEGKLKDPAAYPGASALVRGAAAVLAGLATPVAALLPLIEPGTKEDSPYCKGLVDSMDKARRETAGKIDNDIRKSP